AGELGRRAEVRVAQVRFAGQRVDDRLIRIVVAREDRDAGDIDGVGFAEIGERHVVRPARQYRAVLNRGVGVEEVGRLPYAAAGHGDVDRVAARIGWIDGNGRDACRV